MQNAIIFDMDGTLFKTHLILEGALEQTFDKLRAELLWEGETPLEKYKEIMGVPLAVVWETLCPHHSLVIRERSNEWFQQFLVLQINAGQGDLYEGVFDTLQQLSIDLPIYIASNGQPAYLQAIVTHYDLNRWVKKTYSIEQIASRDKSSLVQKIIEENNVAGGFVIGDRLSDFQAAKENGLQSIGVRFDFAQQQELETADFVVEQFTSILPIIKGKMPSIV
ncbi:nucleosidase [Solibacillus sp. R5-41]|uniref:HAD hydrolase-like protein n=1 Tax=Solibacillus sp. R5-41 TaxID=2048654 RepID=UPI000C126973|nr:HAD hydrolase-like protein [Solibacillus sp. R5-41]ATP40538.1 nucleosidase [Solibacillus sp. R5-41]